MGLSHDSLEYHYKINFHMVQKYGFSLAEINSMIPFEREIYVLLIKQHIEEEKKRQEENKG